MRWKKKRALYLLMAILCIFEARAQLTEDPVTTVPLQAIPGLQYDVVRFVVKPEEKVKLVLTNQDDMGHNLLITTPESRVDVVNASLKLAGKGPKINYIPDSPRVLWSIPVIFGISGNYHEFNYGPENRK
jgi:hypothetical protein